MTQQLKDTMIAGERVIQGYTVTHANIRGQGEIALVTGIQGRIYASI
jgi:hypothetical protein